MNVYRYCHNQSLASGLYSIERIAEYAESARILSLVARSARETGLPSTLTISEPYDDGTRFCDIAVECATFPVLHDFLTRLRWGCGLTDCGIVTGDHIDDDWIEVYDGVCEFAT